jgi:hypothetical protein
MTEVYLSKFPLKTHLVLFVKKNVMLSVIESFSSWPFKDGWYFEKKLQKVMKLAQKWKDFENNGTT